MGLKLPRKLFACPGAPNPVGLACLADEALLLGEEAGSQGRSGTCTDGPGIASWGPQSWIDRPRCRHQPRWAYRPCTAHGPGRWGRSHHQTDCSSGPPAQLPAQHLRGRQVPGSSHTVPQVPWWWISTWPSHLLLPLASLTTGRSTGAQSPAGLRSFPPFSNERAFHLENPPQFAGALHTFMGNDMHGRKKRTAFLYLKFSTDSAVRSSLGSFFMGTQVTLLAL